MFVLLVVLGVLVWIVMFGFKCEGKGEYDLDLVLCLIGLVGFLIVGIGFMYLWLYN